MAKKKDKEKKGPVMDLSVGKAGGLASAVAGAYNTGGGSSGGAAAALGEGLANLGAAVASAVSEKRNTKEGLEKRAGRKEKRAEKKFEKARDTAMDTNRKLKRKDRLDKKSEKLKSQADDLRQQAWDKREPLDEGMFQEVNPIQVGPIQTESKSTLQQVTPLRNKSPMKYNKALVKAVTNTYKSQARLNSGIDTGELIKNIGQTVIGGLGSLRKASDEFAQKGRATRSAIETDIEGVTSEQMIPYINDLKDQFNIAMDSGSKFFATQKGRNKQLEEISRVENAVKNLKESSDWIDMLRTSIDADLDFISESHNHQQMFLYNAIASHGAVNPDTNEKSNFWDMLTYDNEKGTFMIQNPMGGAGDLIDIRQIQPPQTRDSEFLNREKKLKRLIKKDFYKLAYEGYTQEDAQDQIHGLYEELYRGSPESIYDDPDFDEFMEAVYMAGEEDGVQPFEELNIKLLKEIPSEFFEAHFVEGDDELEEEELLERKNERLDLLKNGMKGVNLMKDYIAFKTGKSMKNYKDASSKDPITVSAIQTLIANPNMTHAKVGTGSSKLYAWKVKGGFVYGTANKPYDQKAMTAEEFGLSQNPLDPLNPNN